jgi:hypothetical protein
MENMLHFGKKSNKGLPRKKTPLFMAGMWKKIFIPY